MTMEEAIKIIDCYDIGFYDLSGEKIPADKLAEAFDMAIEAMESKPTPCEKCIHVKSCRKVIILKNMTYKLIKYCSQGAERRKP